MQDAYYKLDDPEVQMQSYAFDVVRSHIPSMDLDEAYADADTIAMHIQETLHAQMADYGYEIVKALITNIEPDQRVKDAMNNINAAQRNQVAASAQGDAQKTLAVKKAEGEKETMRLQGEGVAAERMAIATGPARVARSHRPARARHEGGDGARRADPVHGHDPGAGGGLEHEHGAAAAFAECRRRSDVPDPRRDPDRGCGDASTEPPAASDPGRAGRGRARVAEPAACGATNLN